MGEWGGEGGGHARSWGKLRCYGDDLSSIWETNSRPMPLEAPVTTNTASGSELRTKAAAAGVVLSTKAGEAKERPTRFRGCPIIIAYFLVVDAMHRAPRFHGIAGCRKGKIRKQALISRMFAFF